MSGLNLLQSPVEMKNTEKSTIQFFISKPAAACVIYIYILTSTILMDG